MDGNSASVEAILGAAPDVVLVDEMEHRERMLELIRALTAAADNVTIIVLTLGAEEGWMDEIFAAGADQCDIEGDAARRAADAHPRNNQRSRPPSPQAAGRGSCGHRAADGAGWAPVGARTRGA